MQLTNDAMRFIYHCLLMDDYPPNQIGTWTDDHLIHAYCTDRDMDIEDLPEHWKDADNGHN